MPSKHAIFIVDDDPFLLDMYALKFTQSGFDVKTANGGTQALETLRGGYVPELMLLDIIMPEIDGFEVLKKIKEQNLIPNTKKIVLSNRGQQSDIETGQSLGAEGYIVKASMTPAEVVAQVREILNKKK